MDLFFSLSSLESSLDPFSLLPKRKQKLFFSKKGKVEKETKIIQKKGKKVSFFFSLFFLLLLFWLVGGVVWMVTHIFAGLIVAAASLKLGFQVTFPLLNLFFPKSIQLYGQNSCTKQMSSEFQQ